MRLILKSSRAPTALAGGGALLLGLHAMPISDDIDGLPLMGALDPCTGAPPEPEPVARA